MKAYRCVKCGKEIVGDMPVGWHKTKEYVWYSDDVANGWVKTLVVYTCDNCSKPTPSLNVPQSIPCTTPYTYTVLSSNSTMNSTVNKYDFDDSSD